MQSIADWAAKAGALHDRGGLGVRTHQDLDGAARETSSNVVLVEGMNGYASRLELGDHPDATIQKSLLGGRPWNDRDAGRANRDLDQKE
ncbi:MAG: hypothetical protein M3619_03655 [Myxococcota bacterium]|nr:hypothetical protein [Myxococcota bacterium]